MLSGAPRLVHMCLSLGTFSLDNSGLEVSWKKDAVFYGCVVFPHEDLG